MTPAIFARAALWSAATAFFAWSIWGAAAAVGASVGAAAGILLNGCPPVRLGRRRLSGAFVTILVALLFTVLLPPVAAFFGQPVLSLELANALPSLFLALTAVWCLAVASARYESLRFAEPCAIAFALAWPFLPSSGGNHVRPQWLSDPVLEHGLALTDVLSYAGWIAAVVCLAVLVLSSASAGATSARSPRFAALLGKVLLVALAVAIGWIVSDHLPPVPAAPSTPPPPPVSFSGEPPPPPPPEPLPVAAVQLNQAYLPPARLGAYFFRAPDPVENASAPAQDTSSRAQASILESKVYYLDAKAAPLALAGPASIGDMRPPGPRFKKAQTFRSFLPTQADFSTSSVGDLLRLVLMAPDNDLRPADAQLVTILTDVDSVIAGQKPAPPESRLAALASSSRAVRQWGSSPSLQAAAIVDWIEQNGEFLEKSSAPEEPAEFAKSGLRGGSKHFANLAVALMQAKGIKSRVAEGYAVTAEKEPTDRIVITDGHRDCWPEIQLASGEWTPFPVRPKRVSERDEPPPREDVKDEIFAAIDANESAPAAAPSPLVSGRPKGYILLVMLSLIAALTIAASFVLSKYFVLPSKRIAGVDRPKQHRAALREISLVGCQLFRHRRFGETWRAYADSLGQRFPAAGEAFDLLLDEHSLAEDGDTSSTKWAALYRAAAWKMFLARFSPRRQTIEQPKTALKPTT